jgi:hypothetical protein
MYSKKTYIRNWHRNKKSLISEDGHEAVMERYSDCKLKAEVTSGTEVGLGDNGTTLE